MSDNTLQRAERLRSLKAIRRLFADGRGGFVYPFRYMFFVEAADAEAGDAECGIEAMFSVPKKFHKRANKRNLLKRRTREAFRQSAEREVLRQRVKERSCAVNLAFIYSTKEVHSYKTINNAVQRILGQISEGL